MYTRLVYNKIIKKERRRSVDKLEILKNVLKQQNRFILELINDPRIPEEIKNEYANKYNDLNVQVTEAVKEDE